MDYFLVANSSRFARLSKSKSFHFSSGAAVVDATEVLEARRLQMGDSRAGKSDVEWIFIRVVASNVEGGGACAGHGWREFDCEHCAAAGPTGVVGVAVTANSAAFGPSMLFQDRSGLRCRDF